MYAYSLRSFLLSGQLMHWLIDSDRYIAWSFNLRYNRRKPEKEVWKLCSIRRSYFQVACRPRMIAKMLQRGIGIEHFNPRDEIWILTPLSLA